MNPKRIDIIDYVVMSLYIAIGLFIFMSYKYSLLDQKQINSLLAGLTFIGPLFLFMMYYKRFRILSVWFIWIFIGVLQVLFVLPLRNNLDFNAVNGTYADSGWNLLILVTLIAIFRIISIKLFNQEFVLATRFSDTSERKFTTLDYLLSFLGLIILTIGVSYIYDK